MVKKRSRHRQISHHRAHTSSILPNLPPGIKVLIAYTGVIALFYLLYLLFGVTQPVSVIFGKFVTGNNAVLIEFISLALLVAIIYGLIKRHFWVFYLSLAWFAFSVLNAIISLATFKAELDVLRTVLIISSVVVIVLNGIIAWYIYTEKQYFKTKHLNKETRAKDKFFVYLISVFLIVSALVLITFAANFYNTTLAETKVLTAELQDAPLPGVVCDKKSGSEQDLCFLILSIMTQADNGDICTNIKSDFYKMTCYRAVP